MGPMKYQKALSAAGMILTCTFAMAQSMGNGSSGGGGSFVCRDGDKILTAVSQDVCNMEIATKELSSDVLVASIPKDQFFAAEKELSYNLLKKLALLSPKFYNQVKLELDKVFEIRKIEPVQLRLRHPDSSHYKMPFCLEGEADYLNAAIYDADKLTYSLQVVSSFKRLLDWSALNVHEAIYKILRDEYSDQTSDRTQEIVGELVVKYTDQEILKNIVPLSEFNPLSTKKHESKFEELVNLFNKGDKVSVEDLNRLGHECYVVNTDDIPLNPRSIEKLNINHKSNFQLNKRGKNYELKGLLSFDLDMSLDYINPIIGSLKIPGYGRGFSTPVLDKEGNILATKRGEDFSLPYAFSKDLKGNLLIALRYAPGKIHAPFYYTIYDECLLDGYWSCKKYKEYNILKDFPRFNPLAMMFCPIKKQ